MSCREIRAHIAEPFWYIYVMYQTPEGQRCTFNWRRVHIYDHAIATVMYETCVEAPTAKIIKVDIQQTNIDFELCAACCLPGKSFLISRNSASAIQHF